MYCMWTPQQLDIFDRSALSYYRRYWIKKAENWICFDYCSVGIAVLCVFIFCWLSVKLSHFRVWKLPWSQISIVSVKNKYKFELCFSSPTGRLAHTQNLKTIHLSPPYLTLNRLDSCILIRFYIILISIGVCTFIAQVGESPGEWHIWKMRLFFLLKRESFWCNLPDDLHQTVSCADLKVIILIVRN